MRFVRGYDAVIGALGWFVVFNAVMTFFEVPMVLARLPRFSAIETGWFHVSVGLSGSLFLLSLFDRRLGRSVQVYNDKFEAEGRRPGFSDMFTRPVGGSAIAVVVSILLCGEVLLLAIAQRFVPLGLHVFAAFFGCILVAMQAFKYDPAIRARIVATFPYDPGELPVPPRPCAVITAGLVIGCVVIAAGWIGLEILHLPP